MKLISCCALIFALASSNQAAPPMVIGPRGASGYLPEYTLEAKALAYANREKLREILRNYDESVATQVASLSGLSRE